MRGMLLMCVAMLGAGVAAAATEGVSEMAIQLFGQERAEKRVATGAVFIDGLYVKGPYSISREGNVILVNGRIASRFKVESESARQAAEKAAADAAAAKEDPAAMGGDDVVSDEDGASVGSDPTPTLDDAPAAAGGSGEKRPSAIEELRRRFDYRFQQNRQGGERSGTNAANGRFGNSPAGGRGAYGSGSSRNGFSRPSDGESSVARRYARDPQGDRPRPAAVPPRVEPLHPQTEGLRRVGTRPAAAEGSTSGGGYAVDQRVAHPIFGVGVIRRIETLAADYKLVVDFGDAGVKTLLAKFAKLTRL